MLETQEEVENVFQEAVTDTEFQIIGNTNVILSSVPDFGTPIGIPNDGAIAMSDVWTLKFSYSNKNKVMKIGTIEIHTGEFKDKDEIKDFLTKELETLKEKE